MPFHICLLHPFQALPGGKEYKEVYIFEYDQRFGKAYPAQFVLYDFNKPLEVPEHLWGQCDYILADPPYLNAQCISQFFKTMQLLAKHPFQGVS